MRVSPETVESRREFFRAAARYAVLAGVAAVAAVSARRSLRQGQRCLNRGICSACGVFENCALPAALSAKRFNAAS